MNFDASSQLKDRGIQCSKVRHTVHRRFLALHTQSEFFLRAPEAVTAFCASLMLVALVNEESTSGDLKSSVASPST